MAGPLNADLTHKEVDPPLGLQCRSGHVSLPSFDRGDGEGQKPTRFFQVSSMKDPKVNGVYCEPCLIIANAVAAKQRRGHGG